LRLYLDDAVIEVSVGESNVKSREGNGKSRDFFSHNKTVGGVESLCPTWIEKLFFADNMNQYVLKTAMPDRGLGW
jgi:hypothetical protein